MPVRNKIQAGDGDPRHGTENGYVNHGCRCDACMAAGQERRDGLRDSFAADDPRHGTISGYSNFGCRCELCATAIQEYKWMQNYGITPEWYHATLEAQGNVCWICGTDEWGGKHSSPHVDHCHDTGDVRGLLCNSCNTSLGGFKDDPAVLERAIDYLNKDHL